MSAYSYRALTLADVRHRGHLILNIIGLNEKLSGDRILDKSLESRFASWIQALWKIVLITNELSSAH